MAAAAPVTTTAATTHNIGPLALYISTIGTVATKSTDTAQATVSTMSTLATNDYVVF